MSNEHIQKIIARINQLRALGKSTHSKAECEATMAAAAKLIAEYQLSEAVIESELGKPNPQDEIFTDQQSDWNVVYEAGRTTAWKGELVGGLAKLNGLYLLVFSGIRGERSHRQGSRWRVFGRKSDIEITKYMFEYLSKVIHDLSFDYVPVGRGRGVNPERESWALGCVRGFVAKMTQERDAVMRTATSSAMVLVGNRVDEAKNALLQSDRNLRIASRAGSKAQRDKELFDSGFRKGQTLSVNRGMGGGNNAPPALGQ
jgi:hypothetical protein